MEAAGKRSDLAAHPTTGDDEQGIDQRLGTQPRLANQRPETFRSAKAAESLEGEGHGKIAREGLLVLIAEEELVGTLLGTKRTPHAAVATIVADMLEADGTFFETLVQVARVAAEAFHRRKVSIPCGLRPFATFRCTL
jgi:hypothetical protein